MLIHNKIQIIRLFSLMAKITEISVLSKKNENNAVFSVFPTGSGCMFIVRQELIIPFCY